MTKKRVMCSSKDYESGAGIVLVKGLEFHDFKDHPFKVEQIRRFCLNYAKAWKRKGFWFRC